MNGLVDFPAGSDREQRDFRPSSSTWHLGERSRRRGFSGTSKHVRDWRGDRQTRTVAESRHDRPRCPRIATYLSNPHTRDVKPVGGTWQQGGFRRDPGLRRIGRGNRCRRNEKAPTTGVCADRRCDLGTFHRRFRAKRGFTQECGLSSSTGTENGESDPARSKISSARLMPHPSSR